MSAPNSQGMDSSSAIADALSNKNFSASLDALLQQSAAAATGNSNSSPPNTSLKRAAANSSNDATIPKFVGNYLGANATSRDAAQALPVLSSQDAAATAFPNFPLFQLNQFAFATDNSAAGMARTLATSSTTGRKRHYSDLLVSEDEGERERRRQDRNMREQQRSKKITTQIDQIKDLLKEAEVDFKPDKFSTLVACTDFIQDLQAKSAKLDQEHQSLLGTIAQTSEIVHGSKLGASGSAAAQNQFSTFEDGRVSPLEDDFSLLVKGIDFKSAFGSSPFGCAVASIDGRFMECNEAFEDISGYMRAELLPTEDECETGDDQRKPTKNLSLFNILERSCMQKVFRAMSDMLKRPFLARIESEDDPVLSKENFWSDDVKVCRKEGSKILLHLSLVHAKQGTPRFFTVTFVDKN